MRELPGSSRFAPEPLAVVRAPGEIPPQYLDRNDAMQGQVSRQIHRPHGTSTKKSNDLEFVRELPGKQLRVEIARFDYRLIVGGLEPRRHEVICRMGHGSVHLLRALLAVSGRSGD
jgi:hypothetical protein